jgi:urease gamma subunit
MQGQISSTQGMSRTATGANRAASQADAQVSDPIAHLEGIIVRWNRFKWQQVIDVMPIAEIRAILSKKFGDAILKRIDAEKFLDMEFNIKVLAGQKLAAKAAIAQLIPFLLQLLQQPQLMEYMHQKGWTINFLAIEKIFLRVSELQGAEDIIVPLSDEEKQQVAQLNPNAQRVQAAATLEKLRGANRIQEVQEKGKQDLQNTIVEKSLDHVVGEVPLENEFALAEGRVDRNTDMQELQNGIPGVA